MIEEFEVIETIFKGILTINNFKFKLSSKFFYSYFEISEPKSEIMLYRFYFSDLEFESDEISFSKELESEIKIFILNQKNVRLRHLFNPYRFI